MLPSHLWASQDHKGLIRHSLSLNRSIPWLHTQWGRLLIWQLNPPARLASLDLVLNPISLHLLPTHGVVPIIQLHTRAGIRGYPTLLLLQRVSPTALSSLFVWLSMACRVVSPHPGHECDYQTTVKFTCQRSGIIYSAISYYGGKKVNSSIRWIRDDQNIGSWHLHVSEAHLVGERPTTTYYLWLVHDQVHYNCQNEKRQS